MSFQGYTPAACVAEGANGKGNRYYSLPVRRPRHRYWLHALLFLLTLFTTSAVGTRLAHNFHNNRPAFNLSEDLVAYLQLLSSPWLWLDGLSFSLTLLAILLAHEMGHYVACVYYRLDASLPYFLPSPTIIGTFGAFIRIRQPIYSRRVLFDVGIAGPIAGFVVLLPALAIGLAYSRVIPGIAEQGDLVFGTPALFRLLEMFIFPGVPSADISLHPMARAAWVGVFATALNLLPIGQLDGGHIIYAFFGEKHRVLSRIFLAALVPMGFLYWPWLLWAAVLFFFGLRHPAVYDNRALGPGRRKLGWLALAIFLLCFMMAPVETAEGL